MRCAFCNNPSAELLANNLGVAYGQKIERERIIKLLEIEATKESDYCTLPIDPEHCSMCWHYDRLIALVRGENK